LGYQHLRPVGIQKVPKFPRNVGVRIAQKERPGMNKASRSFTRSARPWRT